MSSVSHSRSRNQRDARRGGSKDENRGGADEPQPRVIIDSVKFAGPIHLSDSARNQLISELTQRDLDADFNRLKELEEVPIRGAWQDQGFFKVEATARAQFISGDSLTKHVSLIIDVDEGLQYRLGDTQFRTDDPDDHLAFPREELRKLIPMSEGDLFAAKQIREGLDALKNLYGSNGYIDFVATPLTEVDDAHQRISLTMELYQEKQYRVCTVEVFGPNPAMETLLRSRLKPGDIFTGRAIENFFKENASALPSDISPADIEVVRNTKSGIVNLRFNFQTCTQLQD